MCSTSTTGFRRDSKRSVARSSRTDGSRPSGPCFFETKPDDPAPTPTVTEKFTSVTYDDYDGLGHHRVRTLGGDFGRGDFHESRTEYNPDRGTFGPGTYTPLPAGAPWILDTYTFVEEEGGDTVDIARRDFAFDADTGFLRSVRTHKNGTTNSNQDLYSLFCPLTPGIGAGGVQARIPRRRGWTVRASGVADLQRPALELQRPLPPGSHFLPWPESHYAVSGDAGPESVPVDESDDRPVHGPPLPEHGSPRASKRASSTTR